MQYCKHFLLLVTVFVSINELKWVNTLSENSIDYFDTNSCLSRNPSNDVDGLYKSILKSPFQIKLSRDSIDINDNSSPLVVNIKTEQLNSLSKLNINGFMLQAILVDDDISSKVVGSWSSNSNDLVKIIDCYGDKVIFLAFMIEEEI